MAKDYIPTAAGFGPTTGGSGPVVSQTPNNQVGFGGEGAPENRHSVPLRILRGTAANAATSTTRVPFDCKVLAIEGNSTSGTTPTVTLSVTVGDFTSQARSLDGTLQTNLITGETKILKAGSLLTATWGNGGGNTIDAQVTVWVQVIGVTPNP